MITAAVLLGGGGTPSPGAEIALQVIFAVIAMGWVWIERGTSGSLAGDPLLVLLACLVLAVPVIQLVPLPALLWHELPGREDQVAALALVGEAGSWRPLAMSPGRTLAALLAMIPATFCLYSVAQLPLGERARIIAVIAAMALISAIVGVFQIVPGGRALVPYPTTHAGWVTGFQANRNATADLLMIGLVALSVTAASQLEHAKTMPARKRSDSRKRRIWTAFGLSFAIILLAMVLTGSRAGIAILPFTLAICWAILKPGLGEGRVRKWGMVLAGLSVLAAGSLVLAMPTSLGKVAGRFAWLGSDTRIEIWRDAWFALERHWPAGVGMGGFGPAMLASESLEFLDTTRPNRAHNDYLELAIEAGALGLIALAACSAIIIAMALRAWRSGAEMRRFVHFSLASLVIIAFHSIVDYPLRSMSLACLLAATIGTMALPCRREAGTEARKGRKFDWATA